MMSPLPDDWNDGERPGWDDDLADIFLDTFPDRVWNDSWIVDLFHDAYVNRDITTLNRGLAREQLDLYAYEDYGIVFKQEFDFQAFFDWKYPPS